MQDNELIRKMLNAVNESSQLTSEEKQTLTEGVHIELDGPEADELVARLQQLSGQPADLPAPMDAPMNVPVEVPAEIPTSVPAPVEVPFATDVGLSPKIGVDEPVAHDFDTPEFDADHFVSDDDGECIECGLPESNCECPTEMAENADHDYGDSVEQEEVAKQTYMWEPIRTKQRLVKGVMGDNPLAVPEEVMERFTKIVDDYVAFLNESENEDGQASPLTANSRNEFKKDPFADDEPKDDGSMSPMSQIEREDVPK